MLKLLINLKETSEKTGIHIYPHLLIRESARKCAGKHYSDFSPEVLKQIYEKAGLKILND